MAKKSGSGIGLCPFSWIEVTKPAGCLSGLFGGKRKGCFRATALHDVEMPMLGFRGERLWVGYEKINIEMRRRD